MEEPINFYFTTHALQTMIMDIIQKKARKVGFNETFDLLYDYYSEEIPYIIFEYDQKKIEEYQNKYSKLSEYDIGGIIVNELIDNDFKKLKEILSKYFSNKEMIFITESKFHYNKKL